MKKSPLILAALLTAAVPFRLPAATVYWDGNGSTTGAGATPNGNWLTNAFWSTDLNGEATTTSWITGDTAVFSAGTDATNAYSVAGSGTSTSPGVTAAGVIIEEGFVTFSGGTLGLGAGFITINAGATLSTDSSLRISTTAGSVWTLNGGTARSTNGSAAGSFIDVDSLITLGPLGGTLAHTVSNILSIVQTGTVISGPGSLTKTGAGVLAIASASTYTGATMVNDGELRIRSAANRLPITTAVTVNSPGIFNLNGVSQQIGSLTGDGLVGLGSATLTVGDATSTTFESTIRDTANAGASGTTSVGGKLTKVGTGTLSLSGANLYTGVTTVSGGFLSFLNTSAKAPGLGTAGAAGSIGLGVGGAGFYSSADVDSLFANTLTGFVLNAASAVGIDTTAGNFTYATSQAAARGLAKLGANTLTLSGANTYTGPTTVSKGTLLMAQQTSLYNNTPASWTPANIIVNPGTTLALSVGGTGEFTTGDVTVLLTNLTTAINNNGLRAGSAIGFDTTNAAGASFTVADVIPNSTGPGGGAVSLAKLGLNTLVLTNANTHTGTTAVSNGTLLLAHTQALQNSTLTTGGIAFDSAVVPHAFTLGGLSGSGGIVLQDTAANSVALSVGNNNTSTAYSGVISGPGTMAKIGTGTLTLTGASTYLGGTPLNAGTVIAANDAALGTGAVTVNAGTTRLVVNDGVTLGNAITVNGGTAGTGTGLIQGSGTGTSTLTGAITINASTTNGGHFAGGGGTLVVNGAITASVPVAVRAGNTVFSGGGTYTALSLTALPKIGANNGFSTAAVADIGSSGAATLDLNGFNQELAGVTRTTTNAATVTNNSGTASVLTLNVSRANSYVFSGVLTGNLALTKSGTGTETLSGVNSYGGLTTVGNGTLALNGGSAIPDAGAVTLANVAGATLLLNASETIGSLAGGGVLGGTVSLGGSTLTTGDASTTTFAGAISGPGGQLIKQGAGVFNLTGAQTYAGLTTTGGTGSVTNIYTALGTGASTLTANAKTSLYASQTLAALTIGAGAEVAFGDGVPPLAGAPEKFGAPALVPEPGALGLLLVGALGLLARPAQGSGRKQARRQRSGGTR